MKSAILLSRLRFGRQQTHSYYWCYLIDVALTAAEAVACPTTFAALQQYISVFCEGSSFGSVYFSVLSPHTYISPHCGATNIKLRLHLPLISSSLFAIAMKSPNLILWCDTSTSTCECNAWAVSQSSLQFTLLWAFL